MEQNVFVWVEIPVSDMDRAKTFYESVFKIEIQLVDFGGLQMGWFPSAQGKPGATGTLIKQDTYVPSQEGPLVYLHSTDVQQELDRIEAAGGKIVQKKTQISPDHGYMGVFIDTEGNRIALHSMS